MITTKTELKDSPHDVTFFIEADFENQLKQMKKKDTPIVWDKPLMGETSKLAFGKHKGKTLNYLLVVEKQYLRWLVEKNIIKVTRDIKNKL